MNAKNGEYGDAGVGARKQEVAPGQWEVVPEGMRSLYRMLAGSYASYNRNMGKLEPFYPYIESLEQNHANIDRARILELIEKWNNGERWIEVEAIKGNEMNKYDMKKYDQPVMIRECFNYRTGKYDKLARMPTDFRDYIPQIPPAQTMYQCCLALGDSPLDAARQVLEKCVQLRHTD